MPVDEAFGVVARIVRSVSIPVTADLEAGYHLSASELVGRLLEAGAVGCNLEDTDHQRGSGLVTTYQVVSGPERKSRAGVCPHR